MHRSELTIEQILEWADAYFERTVNWPGKRPLNRNWIPKTFEPTST